jgi:hypothetical protein
LYESALPFSIGLPHGMISSSPNQQRSLPEPRVNDKEVTE